jgi:hypothetical protein
MDTENTNGQMAENSLAIGYAIKCMEVVFLLGPTVGDIKANIMTTKNRVTEYSPGPMVESTMVHG